MTANLGRKIEDWWVNSPLISKKYALAAVEMELTANSARGRLDG